MRQAELEKSFQGLLARPLIIADEDSAFESTPLSDGERTLFLQFTQDKRRDDWLRSRNALKQVLDALSEETDTSEITFPDRRLSITHAGGKAFCVGDAVATGVGIDYEPLRSINPKVSRWFLADDEQGWLNRQAENRISQHLIRLWTIKEAAFKSYARNRGRSLVDFRVLQLNDDVTDVSIAGESCLVRVACEQHQQGYLAVAVCEEPAP